MTEFVASPGMHRHVGVYACCVGLFKPQVLFDSAQQYQPGFNALMLHEYTHAREKHALMGIGILIVTLGLGYPFWRRYAERRADDVALMSCGQFEFRSFCFMHKHPTSRWGRFLYERSPLTRIEKAIRRTT